MRGFLHYIEHVFEAISFNVLIGNLLCHIRDLTTRYWGCFLNPCGSSGDLAVDGGGEPVLA